MGFSRIVGKSSGRELKARVNRHSSDFERQRTDVMDPEQLVAQLAELRTQNQQLHQALQQMQQKQAQQQGFVQALTELPQSLEQTVGAAVAAATIPARANPTGQQASDTESEFGSWARRTEN